MPLDLPAGLQRYVKEKFDAEVVSVERLGPDLGGTTTAKALGYGEPLRLGLRTKSGAFRDCVFHTVRANEFGHDRRSDRAQQAFLAWDTFGQIPRHAAALDVGVLMPEGPRSLAGSGEPFFVTDWAEGAPYSADLRRLAHGAALEPLDLERARALATYQAELHQRLEPDPVCWRRALRDVIGSGEGIFGICDAYQDGAAGVPPGALPAIERLAVTWRWRLKGRAHRLSRIHGDFHPFNIVFRDGADFTLLDAARGCAGEPADDLTALAVNYVFFAADHPGRWRSGFEPLWRAFWSTYLARTNDREVLACVGPFLAWRALVVACPRFYPQLSAAARAMLVRLAKSALASPRFDPESVEELFHR